MPAGHVAGKYSARLCRPGLGHARPGEDGGIPDTIGRRGLPMSGNFDRLCGRARKRDSIQRP